MPPKRNAQTGSTAEEGGLKRTNQPIVPAIVGQFEGLADVSRYEPMRELSPNAMRALFGEFTQDVFEQVRLQNTHIVDKFLSTSNLHYENMAKHLSSMNDLMAKYVSGGTALPSTTPFPIIGSQEAGPSGIPLQGTNTPMVPRGGTSPGGHGPQLGPSVHQGPNMAQHEIVVPQGVQTSQRQNHDYVPLLRGPQSPL